MPPTQILPDGCQALGTLDARRPRAALLLSLGALLLLPACYFLFDLAARELSGADPGALGGLSQPGLAGIFRAILALLLINVLMVVLHEGAHGIFLALFTRTRPVFALKAYYAYAAAPGWYFPRAHYMVVSLAPLLLISLAGLALMPLLHPAALPWLVGLLTFNAAGSVGDLAVFAWLLFQPAGTLAHDTGDAVTLYRPPER